MGLKKSSKKQKAKDKKAAKAAEPEPDGEEEEDLMGDQSWAQAQSEEAFAAGVDNMFG